MIAHSQDGTPDLGAYASAFSLGTIKMSCFKQSRVYPGIDWQLVTDSAVLGFVFGIILMGMINAN